MKYFHILTRFFKNKRKINKIIDDFISIELNLNSLERKYAPSLFGTRKLWGPLNSDRITIQLTDNKELYISLHSWKRISVTFNISSKSMMRIIRRWAKDHLNIKEKIKPTPVSTWDDIRNAAAEAVEDDLTEQAFRGGFTLPDA